VGENVTFKANGGTTSGYLAKPASGKGPGVIVIQEWWGLNDQVKGVADMLAREGFTALAPDFYHGKGAKIGEPDAAQKLMMELFQANTAAKDARGAARHLAKHPAASSSRVGVVGFCMGGGLALWLATLKPDDVRAVVPYYGVIPWEGAQPDYSKLKAAVQGHYAENDDFAGPPAVAALEEQLSGAGKSFEFFLYPGTEHAFTNHHRPEVFHEGHSERAWQRTIDFLRDHLK